MARFWGKAARPQPRGLAASLALVAVVSSGGESGASDLFPRVTGDGEPLGTGAEWRPVFDGRGFEAEVTIRVDGEPRGARIHLPRAVLEKAGIDGVPGPAVQYDFHGNLSSPGDHQRHTRLVESIDMLGKNAIVVLPRARPPFAHGPQGLSLATLASTVGFDTSAFGEGAWDLAGDSDVEFVRELQRHLRRGLAVSANGRSRHLMPGEQVHATGFSGGGSFALRLLELQKRELPLERVVAVGAPYISPRSAYDALATAVAQPGLGTAVMFGYLGLNALLRPFWGRQREGIQQRPPTDLVIGKGDEVVSVPLVVDSARQLHDAGVPVRVLVHDGAHGWPPNTHEAPVSEHAMALGLGHPILRALMASIGPGLSVNARGVPILPIRQSSSTSRKIVDRLPHLH